MFIHSPRFNRRNPAWSPQPLPYGYGPTGFPPRFPLVPGLYHYPYTVEISHPLASCASTLGGPSSSWVKPDKVYKQDRWCETEEAILIELYSERQEQLAYKAYSSKEWEDLAEELHGRCAMQNVKSEKCAKKCKTKISNLKKKYKKRRDLLSSTGHGKRNDDQSAEEASDAEKDDKSDSSLIPKCFQEMNEIFGCRDSVAPTMESDAGGPYHSVDDTSPCPSTSTPINTSSRDVYDDMDTEEKKELPFSSVATNGKKSMKRGADKGKAPKAKKQLKKTTKTDDHESTMMMFFEQAQDKDQQFRIKVLEMEKKQNEAQQKFAMDALAMLRNIIKDIAKKE